MKGNTIMKAPCAATRGFTLIEVMIVVVIVAVLAAIAWPQYTESVNRARRSSAKTALLEAAQWLEREYTNSANYTRKANGTTINTAELANAPLKSRNEIASYYTLQFRAGEPTAQTFVLEAVPTGTMAADRCGTFALSQTGAKSIVTGDEDLRRQCWER